MKQEKLGRKKTSRRVSVLMCSLLLAIFSAAPAAWAGQCNDGIDNDGDQKVDALVDLANDQTTTKFSDANASLLYQLVEDKLRSIGQLSPRDLLGKDKNGMAFVNNTSTALKVCNILGYRTVLATNSISFDGRDIWTNGDDTMYRWNGTAWERQDDVCSYRRTPGWVPWLTDITCQSRLAQCQDGLDNDGDGLIDYPADPGCVSPTDDSELVHDPACKTPSSPSESKQCNDGIDNDGDGAIDYPADFSCSSKYDNDEANPKAQCQDGIDNDKDGAIDYPADFSCSSKQDNDEANPKAQCQDGIDNDKDGAIDYPADFSCSS
ncbi:MAG: hypothetical protein GX589_05375, partial [Deltaproteobacteria bacterium]|nr:hypothetical protein [Deltaproteobacteria bacterium]